MMRPTEIDLGVYHVRFLDTPTEDITSPTPKHERPWCWVMCEHPETKEQHMMPTWDINRHYLDFGCACGPALDPQGYVTHNSFDGRERYEHGGAPRN